MSCFRTHAVYHCAQKLNKSVPAIVYAIFQRAWSGWEHVKRPMRQPGKFIRQKFQLEYTKNNCKAAFLSVHQSNKYIGYFIAVISLLRTSPLIQGLSIVHSTPVLDGPRPIFTASASVLLMSFMIEENPETFCENRQPACNLLDSRESRFLDLEDDKSLSFHNFWFRSNHPLGFRGTSLAFKQY